MRDRASFAFAVASVAAAVDVGDGTVRDVPHRASAALAHAPWRALRAEELAARRAGHAGELCRARPRPSSQQALPLRDNAFKVPLARNLLVRTLTELCEAP